MKGYLEHGKYIRGTKKVVDSANSQYKGGEHERQRQDHQYEMVQPWKNGQVNQEFIEAYPDESKEVYGFLPKDEEL